jgi:hypothetical protein
MSEYKKNKAVELLTYYLKTSWENSGLKWTEDNDNEVKELINYIKEA